MISFEEAHRIIMESAVELGTETVPLLESYGRVLGRDVASDIDMPPFDKSAMDGYACRSADIDRPLEIVETIPAGYSPQRTVGPGECAKIMTGGVVPDGADRVVMVEHTEIRNGRVIVTKNTGALNICYRAEDVQAGDIVLRKGTLISPGEVAVLAAVGRVDVPVSRRPVIGIVATGSELVDPAAKPSLAEIRDSNTAQLYSQVELAGCEPVVLGIVADDREAIGRLIEREIERIDIFLVSGGVSVGDYDYVPEVLEEKGFELLFQKVAIKPGRPTVFGRRGRSFVFGLPGNPVSTFVVFELLVRPFCYRLMGCSCSGLTVTAQLAGTVKRRKSSRLAHFPVQLDADGKVRPVEYHGSAHIHAYAMADGFISMPVGVSEIAEGSHVRVTLTRRTCKGRCESR
jgi:molybdopterin molybdotransferase